MSRLIGNHFMYYTEPHIYWDICALLFTINYCFTATLLNYLAFNDEQYVIDFFLVLNPVFVPINKPEDAIFVGVREFFNKATRFMQLTVCITKQLKHLITMSATSEPQSLPLRVRDFIRIFKVLLNLTNFQGVYCFCIT